MSGTLTGRKVVLTGGARGIGLATAEELLGRGATVAIGDIDDAEVISAATRLGGEAAGVYAFEVDVTDESSFDSFIEAATAKLGGLDVMINNAGVMPLGAFMDLPAERIQRTFEINVFGVMHGTRLALRKMLPHHRGHIINVGSAAGIYGAPGGATYCATKAATNIFTQAMGLEHEANGIHFTAVMPSFTNTELIAGTKTNIFTKPIEPSYVANAIANAVEKPVDAVYCPAALGPQTRITPLFGARFGKWIGKRVGLDKLMADFDNDKRKAYDDRIANN